MAVTTYLFDLDDTLIDTKIYAEIYLPVLKMVGEKSNLSRKQIEKKAKELGLKKNKFGRWDTGDLCAGLGLLNEYYEILEKKVEVLPVLHQEIISLFAELKKEKRKIGIVSNSMKKTIKLYLKKYGLEHFINFIFSQDDAHCRKNKISYWKGLIKEHHLKPEECLVVGDNSFEDGEMPQRLGFSAFLISSPNDLNNVLKKNLNINK